MTQRDPMVHVRLPPEMKARLEEAAQSDGRSLNNEIVVRLEKSLKAEAESNLKSIESDITDIKTTLTYLKAKLSDKDLENMVKVLGSAGKPGDTHFFPFRKTRGKGAK
jgi:hypothetical protein